MKIRAALALLAVVLLAAACGESPTAPASLPSADGVLGTNAIGTNL